MQAANSQFRGEALAFVRRAIIRTVLTDLLKEASGAMALQHLGILWIIYEYSDANDPITTARLRVLTRATSTAIINYAERLETLGLIKRKRVTASHGRGRAWEYYPALPDHILSQAVKGILDAGIPFLAPAALPESELQFPGPKAQAALQREAGQTQKNASKSVPKAKRQPRRRRPA